MTRSRIELLLAVAALALASEPVRAHPVKIKKADLGLKMFKNKDKAQWKRETRGRRLK